MNKLEARKALALASSCFDQDKLGEAAELCTAILDSAPRNARALYLRAAVLQKLGRGKDAAEDACEAARLRPDLPCLQVAAGSMLHREKCYARALALYQAALEQDSDNMQYHLGAASALRKLGRSEEATAALLQAAAAANGGPCDAGLHAQVQYKLGQHYRSIGKPGSFALAAQAYSRCLELEPGHALAAFWLSATKKLAAAGDAQVLLHRDGNANNGIPSDANGACTARPEANNPAEETPETPPAAAPREYVVGLYNSYAETFDSHLQEALGYRTPTVIVDSLVRLFPGRRWRRCLDLGCGTGLSGQAASSVCDRLVGVDLSPAMVSRAKEKGVYHRLLIGDVTETVERLCRESKRITAPPEERSRPVHPREWEVPKETAEDGGAVVVATTHDQVAGARDACIPVEEGPVTTARTSSSPLRLEDTSGTAKSVNSSSINSQSRGQGELVISCDVFGYIGDLRACFKAVRELVDGNEKRFSATEPAEKAWEPSAVFAFSAEAPLVSSSAGATEEGSSGGTLGVSRLGYELQGTGRYTHSREYLEAVCGDAGFRVVVANNVVLRKNAGVPVRGFVFVTEAVGAASSAS